MANEIAPTGQVFVCNACGKRSRDRYGTMKIDRGWDVSCSMWSVLCYESSLVFGENGLVVKAEGVPSQVNTHGETT